MSNCQTILAPDLLKRDFLENGPYENDLMTPDVQTPDHVSLFHGKMTARQRGKGEK